MQINFQLSFDDYRAAQGLHSTRSTWARINYLMNYYLSPLFGVLAFAQAIALDWSKSAAGPTLWVVLGAYLFVGPLYLRVRLKRSYKRTSTGSGVCTLTMVEDGILAETSNTESKIGWAAIQYSRENERLFMLYTAPAKFIVIPKRACSAEQISRDQNHARAMVQKQLLEQFDSVNYS